MSLRRYQHTITGARSPSAKECMGGIVADEMGLGKSLTVLSAIAGSLDQALAYAQTMTDIGASGYGVIAAKSTLVVVPSARTSIDRLLLVPADNMIVLIDSWVDEVERYGSLMASGRVQAASLTRSGISSRAPCLITSSTGKLEKLTIHSSCSTILS